MTREESAEPAPTSSASRAAEPPDAQGFSGLRGSSGLRALDAADSAWLRVDRDENHMIITAVLVLDRSIAFEQLQARLDERLQPYPRLRHRIIPGPLGVGPPRWQEDPEFDITRQTRLCKLDAPADQGALERFIGQSMHRDFDPERPRWRIDYVDNFIRQPGSHAAAVVVRVHHCMADGVALLRVLLSLADEPPLIDFPTAAAAWARPQRKKRFFADLMAGARRVAQSAGQLLSFLRSDSDPASRFRDPLGTAKRAAWSNPIALADIKRVGRALGATVNEVLLSAAAGALGRVMADDAEFHDDLVLRGVVPVNLRANEELENLGNRFGLVFMPMRVGTSDPRARVAETREAMAQIKASPEALAWFAILRTLGRVPSWIEALGVELFSRKASLVITSLAGPRDALHLCGAQIDDVMFWVPSAGNIGLGMSMLSYRDRVRLGVATDAGQLADPRRIVRAFEAEVQALVEAAR